MPLAVGMGCPVFRFARSPDGLFVRKGAGQQRVDYQLETEWCIVARDRQANKTEGDETKKLFAGPAKYGREQKGTRREGGGSKYFNGLDVTAIPCGDQWAVRVPWATGATYVWSPSEAVDG